MIGFFIIMENIIKNHNQISNDKKVSSLESHIQLLQKEIINKNNEIDKLQKEVSILNKKLAPFDK